MPRKKAELIVAAQRIAEARRIASAQRDLVARLKATGQPAWEAESALQSYLSSLKHLEDHEEKLKQENKEKKRENKKRGATRPR